MMTPTSSLWQPRLLIAGNLVALILFLSWLLEPTRSLWIELDHWAFWAMNRSLEDRPAWQTLWAIANNRLFDAVAAIAMLLLLAHRALVGDRQNIVRYVAVGLLMAVTIIVAMQLGKMLPIERPSATAEFPQALRLSQLVPSIPTKDFSSDSFPGDHGLVLLVYAGIVAFYLPRAHAITALVLAVLFTVPRLMSGAHWLSDELVGAVALALVALSWLFATPLHDRILSRLEPWVGRWRFFNKRY